MWDYCEFENLKTAGSFLSVILSESVTKRSSLALCIVLPPQFKATESKQTKTLLHPAWLPTLSLQVNSCPTHTETLSAI